MGSDDLFHKRKARTIDKLERKVKTRLQSQRFLIVCEGTKTEPNYFNELVASLGIRPQTVRIAPNNGSSPDRIVEHALKLYEDDALSGDSFDKVFCVFDRDMHTTFDAAVQRVHDLKKAKKSKPFEAITSSPCFEYWLLLHFGLTDQPFHAAGKKSVCDNLVVQLRKKPGFKNYNKGQQGVYAMLKGEKTSTAIAAAQQVRQSAEATGQKNPLTHVDTLVKALLELEQVSK
ncbi:MAG: RloB family protein [Polaromonas sp.]